MTKAPVVLAAAVALMLVGAIDAHAQPHGTGIGPRLSWVRADPDIEAASFYWGGLLRFRGTGRHGLELALDYKSETRDLTPTVSERVVDYPIQASYLGYLLKSAFAPYFVGGIGWYAQRIDLLDSDGEVVVEGETTRKLGYHAGIGAEIGLGRHASIHADYRYTFIHFGDDDDREPGALPIPGSIVLQERLKLSHEGSMWTTGLTFYF